MTPGGSLRVLGVLASVAISVLAAGCSSDDGDSVRTTVSLTPTAVGYAGGGGAPATSPLVSILGTLPIFPASDVKDGAYATGGSTGENLLTGFKVLPGTSVDDVMSFFSQQLPAAGWQQEGAPWTETSDKGGGFYQTVISTFVKDDVRLAIVIPLTSKIASPGVVTTVELQLAPKGIQLFGSPADTPAPTEGGASNEVLPSTNPTSTAAATTTPIPGTPLSTATGRYDGPISRLLLAGPTNVKPNDDLTYQLSYSTERTQFTVVVVWHTDVAVKYVSSSMSTGTGQFVGQVNSDSSYAGQVWWALNGPSGTLDITLHIPDAAHGTVSISCYEPRDGRQGL